MRSFTMVGTGALGCLYGARLHAAGHGVHFLARSDATALATTTMRVDLPAGQDPIEFKPAVYDDPRDVPHTDVALIALKAFVPNPAAPLLPHLDTDAIVTLQNGLGIEADLAPTAGNRPLLGGLCFTAANRVAPGRVELLGGGSIAIGEHGATTVTDLAAALAVDFNAAHIPTTTEQDVAAARWKKLCWNVPFNSLAALHGLTPDVLLADPEGERLVLTIMTEVAAAADANGHPYPADHIDDMIARTHRLPAYLTSMGLDALAGRDLETEVIIGRPLSAGRTRGVPMPVTQSLYAALRLRFPSKEG